MNLIFWYVCFSTPKKKWKIPFAVSTPCCFDDPSQAQCPILVTASCWDSDGQSQSMPWAQISNQCVQSTSYVWFFVTTWTVACQGPISMQFPRQDYWSRLSLLSAGNLPNPGIEPTSLTSPALAGGFFTIEPRVSTYYRNFTLINKVFEFKVRNDFHAALGFTGRLSTNTLSPTLKLLLFRDILEMWA